MIDYIIKYQNNYVSSYLFQRTFPSLMEKGISVSKLLESKVFMFSFDFDEWPSSHVKDDTLYRPYNGSIFKLRSHYKTVYPEKEL